MIQSSDNPIFWWLELGECGIAGNAVSNRWLHSIGEAEKTHSLRRRFISLILQTAFLGDRDAWKRYCCLQAENAYAQIEDDNEGERTSSMCLKCFGGVLPKTIIGKYFGPLSRELQTPGLLNMPKLYRWMSPRIRRH